MENIITVLNTLLNYFFTLLPQVLEGLKVTLELFILTLILSIPLGIVVALGRLSKIKIINKITSCYILIMRGTPLLLQIVFIFFGLPNLNIVIDRFPAAIIAFTFLGLADKAKNYPCELSGGQKQRVAIGRALALNPKLMCFDEPTSALDPSLTKDVASLIKSLSKKGMSMLIITHDMEFAKLVSNKIVSMDSGIIIDKHIYNDKSEIS